MNYYDRYPGDYARDTRHLSLMQHGVYCLLLDYCYGSDTDSLPTSDPQVYRICGAVTRPEREAVRYVVEHFFPGRKNPRVTRQLAESLRRSEAARAKGKKGNEVRWGRYSDSPGDSPGDAGSDSSGDSPGESLGHRSPITSLHSPFTIHQPPDPSPHPNAEFKKQNSLLCTEHFANSAKSPALNGSGIFMKLCKTGEEWEVPMAKIEEWEESYPDVDVRLTLLGIRQYLRDNPTKRKTPRGMLRFLGAWMMREQDKPDPRSYAKTKH